MSAKSIRDNAARATNAQATRIVEAQAAELAQLRADLQAAQERIAEQARQLDEARNVINAYRALPTGPKGYTSMPLFDLHNAADEWLAANPASELRP